MKIPEKVLVVLNETEWHKSMHKTVMELSHHYGPDFSFLHVFPEIEKDNRDIRGKILKFKTIIRETKITFLEQELAFGDINKIILDKDNLIKPDLILIDGGENQNHVGKFILKLLPDTEGSVWGVERTRSSDMKKIICPVNFSDTSKRAFKNALDLANVYRAELEVLTVNDFTDSTSVFMQETLEEVNEESIEDGEKKINSLLKEWDTEGVKLKRKVRLGDTAEEINKEIIEWEADLIIIGAHGSRGIRKKLTGSVAEKVVKKVPCSFLVTKSEMPFKE